MERGYLCFVLHAHLPFVRHPDYMNFLEETWLFEAISETYLPLLRVLEGLAEDEVPYRITISVSPTLSAMLTDEYLQGRYISHVTNLLALSEKELSRTEGEEEFHHLAKMYHTLFRKNLEDFTQKYKKNILKGFRELEKAGYVELITSAATHSFFPVMQEWPEAVFAQIQTAVISHGRTFGSDPKGLWIPEFGYYPGLEKYMKVNNCNYFFVAAHGLLYADDKPKYGVYAPISSKNGVHAFGRDLASSYAVWSSEEGYPGDIDYREFYRDIGFDLPMDYIAPFIHEGNLRVNTGFKYYRITGNTSEKKPYNPERARIKAEEHAENFLYNRLKQIQKLEPHMDRPPIIVSPYDAELFGHWWFEGPMWIDFLLRKISELGDGSLLTVTPTDYLEKYPENQIATPAFSSWGNKGYSEVWVNGSNDWIYRHIHKAIERMCELANRFPNETGLKKRVLNQAAREVLLSQASDWPFIMKTGTTVPYAVKRVKEHISNFTNIYENLCRNTVNTEWLTQVEKKNNIFPDLDYRIFAS